MGLMDKMGLYNGIINRIILGGIINEVDGHNGIIKGISNGIPIGIINEFFMG